MSAEISPSHLEQLARRLVKKHKLRPQTLPLQVSRRLARELRESPGINRCRYRNGREEWSGGYVTPTDYDRYLREHQERLAKDYPIERCYWPAAFEYWNLYCKDLLPKDRPWLSWYVAILGTPYPDLPGPMYWRAIIYHLWKERSKDWRHEWERKFTIKYPEAEQFELFKGQNRNNYTELWRPWAYVVGFTRTQDQWERDALQDLANRRGFGGLYA